MAAYVDEEGNFHWNSEEFYYEYHTRELVEQVRESFDGPIYRGEEDLESVRNSESNSVAVVAEDQPMIFFVSREKFLRGEFNLNSSDLLKHAGVF